MPLYDSTAKDAALDAMWGSGHAASMPATFDFGLLTSDPRVSGLVEEMPADGTQAAECWGIWVSGALFDFAPLSSSVTFTGYARLTAIANDDAFWDAASGGEKDSQPQTFTGLAETITATVRF